jgi:hypothetical protein
MRRLGNQTLDMMRCVAEAKRGLRWASWALPSGQGQKVFGMLSAGFAEPTVVVCKSISYRGCRIAGNGFVKAGGGFNTCPDFHPCLSFRLC